MSLNMAAIVSLLRGVNLGSHHRIKMDKLRALYESLGLRNVQTFLQSGNVVFTTEAKNLDSIRRRLEKILDQTFAFHSDIILRTTAELREAVARNPFAARKGIDPSRLLVMFLAEIPTPEARKKLLAIQAHPEELRIEGREVYIYYPNGLARPKLSWAAIEKTLGTSSTGRNWNTVRKLLGIAEGLEPVR